MSFLALSQLAPQEKHQHERDALEHYLASVKEQRDQDQRRHEQQIQQMQAEICQLQQSLIVKQDDVTRFLPAEATSTATPKQGHRRAAVFEAGSVS